MKKPQNQNHNHKQQPSLSEKDVDMIWHPYTQMKTALPPIALVKAKDVTLYAENGDTYIDAISSWWVNIHGHGRTEIAQRIFEQAKKLDHTIFAGFTHEPAIELAEKLLKLLPEDQSKIFYSDNGSTAIEVALKMAIQYWKNKKRRKTKIIALKNSYHGDTFGAMAVGQRSGFTLPFQDMLFDVDFLDLTQEPEKVITEFKKIITKESAAFIFEPLVQGAGGMFMYSPELLNELIQIAHENEIITIADEVMTGFGRTGKWFASLYLKTTPNIFCVSKGITGGVLPLAVTSCTEKIYQAFYSTDKQKTFFHGHSYTANAIAISAALASYDLLMQSSEKIEQIEKSHNAFIQRMSASNKIENLRCRGTILAFDVKTQSGTSYFNELRDHLYESFLKEGVLLRPLGNVVYILPPYCITPEELNKIYTAIENVLASL
ncbi:MAG: adenosylmethionine--8-amino-7-oxononanoate transaminase [Leptospirales bacterium]